MEDREKIGDVSMQHQSYKEVKNYLHNTLGFNKDTFQSVLSMEIQKMFLKMNEDGTLDELFQNEIQKYLGSWKSGLPRSYTPQPFKIRELITQYMAEVISSNLQVQVTLKPQGNQNG